MSLGVLSQFVAFLGFPRVSGDEPGLGVMWWAGQPFSPRERG